MTLDQLRQAGAKGGQTTARRHGSSHYQRIGCKGGEVVVTKYGREHFIAIGRKSAAARRAWKKGNG